MFFPLCHPCLPLSSVPLYPELTPQGSSGLSCQSTAPLNLKVGLDVTPHGPQAQRRETLLISSSFVSCVIPAVLGLGRKGLMVPAVVELLTGGWRTSQRKWTQVQQNKYLWREKIQVISSGSRVCKFWGQKSPNSNLSFASTDPEHIYFTHLWTCFLVYKIIHLQNNDIDLTGPLCRVEMIYENIMHTIILELLDFKHWTTVFS